MLHGLASYPDPRPPENFYTLRLFLIIKDIAAADTPPPTQACGQRLNRIRPWPEREPH